MHNSIPIIIDSRERDAAYFDRLSELHPVIIRTLPVGDIIIHDLAIQRKTINDLFLTLHEGRLFSQLRELKRSFRRQLLLIEGTGMRYHLDNAPTMGLYIRICAGWQIPILHTRDPEHTASVLITIYRQDVREPASPKRPRPRNPLIALTNPALLMLTAILGIGAKHACALLQHFGSEVKPAQQCLVARKGLE